jgi:hypothetical protein
MEPFMTPLLLALCVAQAPLSEPPLAPPTTEAVTPGAEPAEVKQFAQFVERHLLAVGASGAGFEVRQREHVFRLQDEDFEAAFTLVPDALNLARASHEAFVLSARLQITGLAVVGAGLVATLVATLVRSAVIPLLVGSLVASGAGLVLALVALPFALSAQTKFFSAIATYNRGLLDLRPPQLPLGGGLTLALPQ